MGKIRVGLAGSRFAAEFHINGHRSVRGLPVEVAGVYSPTPSSRSAFAAKHGVREFSSLEEMIAGVDVVDICAPGRFHEECAVAAAEAGKHVIVEKPFTGYFGPPGQDDSWRGDTFDKSVMLKEATASALRITKAAEKSGVKLMYAENWVYAPAVQKEAEILRASKGGILWMQGAESHSGSHSQAYGIWRLAGGGSLMGKGCHPLSAALYLKREEGMARSGVPVRPRSVNARTHRLTASPACGDRGFLRKDYFDVEDYCQVHLTFEDGSAADIFASEVVMGGVYNWLEIFADNHRCRCNINPHDCVVLYNPDEKQLKDVYISEKIGTKQGWSFPSPNEDWMSGYPQEFQDFMECVHFDREPKSGAALGMDTVSVIYAAYLSAERGGAEVTVPLPGEK
jgi:predicted dehydrogenase